MIIYAWVNDENTLREAGPKTNTYATFEKRLSRGDPPGDWTELRASVPGEADETPGGV